jgi:hypothetical protein
MPAIGDGQPRDFWRRALIFKDPNFFEHSSSSDSVMMNEASVMPDQEAEAPEADDHAELVRLRRE